MIGNELRLIKLLQLQTKLFDAKFTSLEAAIREHKPELLETYKAKYHSLYGEHASKDEQQVKQILSELLAGMS